MQNGHSMTQAVNEPLNHMSQMVENSRLISTSENNFRVGEKRPRMHSNMALNDQDEDSGQDDIQVEMHENNKFPRIADD